MEATTKRRPGRPVTKVKEPPKQDSQSQIDFLNNKEIEGKKLAIQDRWNKLFSQYGNANVDYMGALQSWYTSNPWVQNQRLKNLKSIRIPFLVSIH